MTSRKLGLALVVAGLLVPVAVTPAQALSASFPQNPVLVGQPIVLTVTDSTGNGWTLTSSTCWGKTIRAGTPQGPIIYQPTACTFDFIIMPPYASWTITWSQLDNAQQQVPPGTYYFMVPGNAIPIRIQGTAPEPTLTQTSPVQVGQVLQLALASVSNPGSPYTVAFSATTNTGFSVGPAAFISLDIDALFLLSVPFPPPSLFVNTIGFLDAAGSATGIAVGLPNLPALHYQGFAVQGALLDIQGQLAVTNPLVFSIP